MQHTTTTQEDTMQGKAHSYQPTNELTAAVKLYAAERFGIPAHCFFCRWYTNGTSLWLESSSGSTLMTVDFAKAEIRYTGRVPAVAGQVDQLPAGWADEMLGFTMQGEYADEAQAKRMEARYARHNREREQLGFRAAMDKREIEHRMLAGLSLASGGCDYPEGTLVLARPQWPTKPSYGIWTSDKALVEHGRPARISGARGVYGGVQEYSVQFDRDGDGTYNDCHWPLKETEIVRVLTPAEAELHQRLLAGETIASGGCELPDGHRPLDDRVGVPALGMAGWGCPDRDCPTGDWLSDGYPTADDAVWAAKRALRLERDGASLQAAREQAADEWVANNEGQPEPAPASVYEVWNMEVEQGAELLGRYLRTDEDAVWYEAAGTGKPGVALIHSMAPADCVMVRPQGQPPCTCEVADVGTGETGPMVQVVGADEHCPSHGRKALPEQWQQGDEMERGYVLSSVASHFRGEPGLDPSADPDTTMRMYEHALQAIEATLDEDDGHNADRAIGRVVDAWRQLYYGEVSA